MYELQVPSRRFLQEAAVVLASSPVNSNENETQNDDHAFDISGRFSPSMAVILVVLLSAFFFMAFFSVYVRRCSSRQTDPMPRSDPAHPAAVNDAGSGSQGVDAAFLELLPLIAYSSAKKKGSNVECVVCLADFEEGEPLCQLPRCKHVFHRDCINMWLFSHTTCPLCRRSVVSDGSRSFRWGVGSASLRMSMGRRGSRHRSGRAATTGLSTSGQEIQPDMAEQTNSDRVQGERYPRSHSTGHLMVKQSQTTALRAAMGEHEVSEEARARPTGGCLPLTPTAPYQRSRSFAAFGDRGSAQIRIGEWVREAGASLKRVLSVKTVSSVGAFGASSSSAATFNRISPV